ncbi:tRNA/rRNA methyltransferase [Acetobacter orientalis]|uniref:tRNA/rRNA methyltransferase n=1 Tax=Acetobacter orientalis TaxID=146474 RepID=A0A2Z5ZKB4_9PROT|nr:tRNA/rRNA methyltransferase [Acetobacter orientalis]
MSSLPHRQLRKEAALAPISVPNFTAAQAAQKQNSRATGTLRAFTAAQAVYMCC